MTRTGRWLLGQVGQAAVAAWVIASLVFLVSRLAPVGPADLLLDESDGLSTYHVVQPQVRQVMEERLGLRQPIFYVTRTRQAGTISWHWHGSHNQYHQWVSGLLHGELGISFRDGQPLGPRLRAALAYTLPLTGLAILGTIAGALVLGVALAGGAPTATGWRTSLRLVLTGLQGLPLFVVALGLLFAFANPDALNFFPADAGPNAADEPLSHYLLRFVLPALALVLTALPELTLLLAATLHHELGTPYATTARAKGLPNRQLIRRHALPNALLPLFTALADLLPSLVAGAVVVETIFALPGTGRLLAEAVAMHDYPVVVASVLLMALARLLALALADALSAWADPRIRLVS